MFISALVAVALFAAPEAAQSGGSTPEAKAPAEAKAAPRKTCYTAKPSGSRLPRKVCVTEAPKAADREEAAEASAAQAPPADAPKSE